MEALTVNATKMAAMPSKASLFFSFFLRQEKQLCSATCRDRGFVQIRFVKRLTFLSYSSFCYMSFVVIGDAKKKTDNFFNTKIVALPLQMGGARIFSWNVFHFTRVYWRSWDPCILARNTTDRETSFLQCNFKDKSERDLSVYPSQNLMTCVGVAVLV